MSQHQQPLNHHNMVGHTTSQQTFQGGQENKSNNHHQRIVDEEWLPVMNQVDDSPVAHYYSNPNPNTVYDDHHYGGNGSANGSLPMPSILINPLANHQQQNWQAHFVFDGMV